MGVEDVSVPDCNPTGSVQFSCSVISDSLGPHGLQHARLPCPSPTPAACSNSCPLSQWSHPILSSSVIPFSSCLQSFPTGYLLVNRGKYKYTMEGSGSPLFMPTWNLLSFMIKQPDMHVSPTRPLVRTNLQSVSPPLRLLSYMSW